MAGNYFRISQVIFGTALLLAVLLGFPVSTVQADAAPPPPPAGSDLFPSIGNTNVRLMSEYVVIDVDGASEYSSAGHAIVTAQFFMKNLGGTMEFMNVRFPMNLNEYKIEWELENNDEYCEYISGFPSIDEFRVWVDGDEVAATVTEKTVVDYSQANSEDNIHYVDLKCWAYFDVVFPPNEIVEIKVSYKVPAYSKGTTGLVQYVYVLQTGTGWKDTIGKADIVARLPYDVNHLNFGGCRLPECTFQGKEITWHFEDFEPEHNIAFTIIATDIWERVLYELDNIERNPLDNGAWHRLGSAYADATWQRRGFMPGDAGEELFFLSKEAFETALKLNPEDLESRYSYAALMCWNSEWNNFGDLPRHESFNICIDAVNYVLTTNPEYERLKYLVSPYGYIHGQYAVPLTDDQTGNLLFATLAPPTLIPTQNPTRTQSAEAVSSTSAPATIMPTTTSSLSSKAAISTPGPDSSQQGDNTLQFVGIGIVLLLVIGLVHTSIIRIIRSKDRYDQKTDRRCR